MLVLELNEHYVTRLTASSDATDEAHVNVAELTVYKSVTIEGVA